MPHSSKIWRMRGFTNTFVQAAPAGACSVLRTLRVRWRGVGVSCIVRSICHQPARCPSPFDLSLSMYLFVTPMCNDGPRWGTGWHTYHPLKEDYGLCPAHLGGRWLPCGSCGRRVSPPRASGACDDRVFYWQRGASLAPSLLSCDGPPPFFAGKIDWACAMCVMGTHMSILQTNSSLFNLYCAWSNITIWCILKIYRNLAIHSYI